jgi:hypothetical protein
VRDPSGAAANASADTAEIKIASPLSIEEGKKVFFFMVLEEREMRMGYAGILQ